MPRIQAPTVREHRARMEDAVLLAAEDILREQGPAGLTTEAVASATGIARTSLYRYIGGIDDLRWAVIARHIPAWTSAVTDEMLLADGPRAEILAWAEGNLRYVAQYGHGWLVRAFRAAPAPGTSREAIGAVHRGLFGLIVTPWNQLRPGDKAGPAFVQGLLQAGFTRLEAGDDVDAVVARIRPAVLAILDS